MNINTRINPIRNKLIFKRPTAFITLAIFLLSVFTGFLLELFHRSMSIASTIRWIFSNPSNFILSTLFVASIYLLITCFLGNFWLSSAVGFGIFAVTGYSNIKKLGKIGTPLYPVDFYHLTYIKSFFDILRKELSIFVIILGVLFIVGALYLLKRMPKLSIKMVPRFVFLLIAIFTIYSYVNFDSSFLKSVVAKANIHVDLWDQQYNYDTNGFVFGLLSNLQSDVMESPEGYSREAIDAIVEKYIQEAKEINSQRTYFDDKQPNIIFLLNETFWDPTRLNNLHFSEDPMPYIREIMREYSSGLLLSPAFGGQTANVEFEVLTGMSMYNIIPSAIPYQQAFDKKHFMPSIVSMLNARDYNTVALHPYDKVFYRRDKVYSIFGFDNFIGEKDMTHTETFGAQYISDQAVTNEIMDILSTSDKPVFIHAVTMQNHIPIPEGKFGENSISITGLSEEEYRIELETYTEGIKWSDHATKDLLERLDMLDRPTVVVFYGDHLPVLKSGIYEEGGLEQDNLIERDRAFAETSLFIYSNLELEREELNSLSPAFLGVTLWDMLEQPLTPYQVMLNNIRQAIPGLEVNVLVGPDGHIKYNLTEEEQELLREYKLIQYDMLIGSQYSSRFFK
jgi:phosphoglycerol transferase MdoB-like AlkP superfamily enzyme